MLVCWFCKTFLTVVAAVQPGMVSTDIGHCFTLLTSFLVFCLLSVRLFWGLGLWRSDIYIYSSLVLGSVVRKIHS